MGTTSRFLQVNFSTSASLSTHACVVLSEQGPCPRSPSNLLLPLDEERKTTNLMRSTTRCTCNYGTLFSNPLVGVLLSLLEGSLLASRRMLFRTGRSTMGLLRTSTTTASIFRRGRLDTTTIFCRKRRYR